MPLIDWTVWTSCSKPVTINRGKWLLIGIERQMLHSSKKTKKKKKQVSSKLNEDATIPIPCFSQVYEIFNFKSGLNSHHIPKYPVG